MFRNYIKIAWRNLWRRKLFTTVNILGMAVGLICVAFLALCVQQMLVRDKFHKNLDRLYLVQTDNGQQSVYPLLKEMLASFPQVENGTRILQWDAPWFSYQDKEVSEAITYADAGFFKVFTYPLKYGNKDNALKDKFSIVLSSEVAHKLFGSENPVGKTLELSDKRRLIVSGVMAPIPPNASLRPAVLVSTENLDAKADFKDMGDWYNCFTETFVLLKPGASTATVEKQLKGVVATRFATGAKDRVMSLMGYGQFANKYGELNIGFYVYGLSCIALFILIIVAINLVNLNMAVSLTRIQEVGVRKVMGAGRKGVLLQFFTEAGLTVGIGCLLAWGLAFVLMPVLNERLSGIQLTSSMLYSLPFIGGWLLGIMLLTLIAGGYPALYLSAVKLVNAMKGKLQSAPRKVFSQRALIIAQFVIAVVFITGSLVMRQQLRYMEEGDVKFNKAQVLTLRLDLDYKDTAQARSSINALMDRLRQYPQVQGLSTSQSVPGKYYENYNTFVPGNDQNKELSMRQAYIDNGFLTVFGVHFLEGRNFSPDLVTDEKAVVINQTAMRQLGWTSIAGKTLRTKGGKEDFPVIGLTEDYHYRSLAGSVQPLIHFYGGKTAMHDWYNYLNIHINPKDAAPVIAMLRKGFENIPSHRAFSYSFADEIFNEQYKRIESLIALINYFTLISVVIACAGIFALVSLAAQQRTREIGIRKVLGAGIVSIVALLSKDFIKLVGIAVLIAAPLAWWLMNRWLQDFAYSIKISWWLLAGAGLVTALIALFTVGTQSLKAALMNPVKAIKTE
ncbi:ABC transporter permease [Chitinophaga agrisoli]|nr:ABC transporter permease [Chitinophaga agrisoli]